MDDGDAAIDCLARARETRQRARACFRPPAAGSSTRRQARRSLSASSGSGSTASFASGPRHQLTGRARRRRACRRGAAQRRTFSRGQWHRATTMCAPDSSTWTDTDDVAARNRPRFRNTAPAMGTSLGPMCTPSRFHCLAASERAAISGSSGRQAFACIQRGGRAWSISLSCALRSRTVSMPSADSEANLRSRNASASPRCAMGVGPGPGADGMDLSPPAAATKRRHGIVTRPD